MMAPVLFQICGQARPVLGRQWPWWWRAVCWGTQPRVWPRTCLSLGCGPNQALLAAIWGWGSGAPQEPTLAVLLLLQGEVVPSGTDGSGHRTMGEV